MAQRFKAILGISLILFALLIFYSLAGASDADTFTAYRIDASDPSASWMGVSVTLRPSPRLFVDLYLLDRRQLGKNRVREISVMRGKNSLLSWEPFPGRPDIQRIWTGFSTEPVTFRYQAHGQWRKAGDRMFSYLGPEYGYLRGEVFLYTPVTIGELLLPGTPATGSELGRSTVAFHLPPGWQIVSALDIEHLEVQTAVLRQEYFAVGNFDLQEIQLGSDTLKLGLWQGLPDRERQRLRGAIPQLYETVRATAGFPMTAETCFQAVIVLPVEPIHGSVSGAGSLVAEDRLESISHGLFQWWIGSAVTSAPNAMWLEEGFSTYYQARLLYNSGLWTQVEFEAALLSYQNSLWPGAAPQPVNLVQASERMAKLHEAAADPLVQYGGALLAYQLDMALQAQGSSLDSIWPALKARQQPIRTQEFLTTLQTLGGSELRAAAQAVLYGQSAMDQVNQP